MELRFSGFNKLVADKHNRLYAKNSHENFARIKAEFQKADYGIDTLPRFGRDVPALVIGSGPSLDAALPFLGAFQGIIFASPSQLNILERAEIVPNYVVVVDATDDISWEQIGPDRDTHGMTLLTSPYVSPKTLEAWKGNRRYFQLIADDPHFHDAYPWIKVGFPVMGSVNNAEVLIANWMGCSPIVLCGVDYCFPGGRKRAQDWRKRSAFIFDPKPLEVITSEEGTVGETGISQETAYYANLLLGIWSMYKMPLVQVGDQGAMTDIPFIPPEDLGKEIHADPPTDVQLAAVAATLAEYGMRTYVGEDGIGHFHYKEQDEAAVGPASAALEDAKAMAEWWTKVES